MSNDNVNHARRIGKPRKYRGYTLERIDATWYIYRPYVYECIPVDKRSKVARNLYANYYAPTIKEAKKKIGADIAFRIEQGRLISSNSERDIIALSDEILKESRESGGQ